MCRLVIVCSFVWLSGQKTTTTQKLSRGKAGIKTIVNSVCQAYVAIERVSELFQLLFDFGNIKAFGQRFERDSGALHFEQHGAAVGSDLLIRFELVNGQTVARQGRRNFVHETGIIRSLQRKIARVCLFIEKRMDSSK